MSELVNQAAVVLKEAAEKMRKISDQLSADIGQEDFEKVNLAYKSAAVLDVYASQMSGEEKVYEGFCQIDNGRAVVTIGGFEVRDNIQFEIWSDGKWIKGHRQNTQYGQAFYFEGGNSMILTSDYKGKVTLPLKMDE